MNAYALSIATATYRSRCPCKVSLDVPRGEIAPACPKCGSADGWMFVRSRWTFPPQIVSEPTAE